MHTIKFWGASKKKQIKETWPGTLVADDGFDRRPYGETETASKCCRKEEEADRGKKVEALPRCCNRGSFIGLFN